MDQWEWPGGVELLLVSICDEWNAAEADMKRAENICGEIILPSVNELRYAGRRIIDALVEARAGDLVKARDLLTEARFNCLRARHDSIDAGTAKVAADIEDLCQIYGAPVVAAGFANLPSLLLSLQNVREAIATSREKREDRDIIYQSIVAGDFRTLIRLHAELKAVVAVMRPIADEKREQTWRESAYAWGGYALAVFFGLLALVAWKAPHLLGG